MTKLEDVSMSVRLSNVLGKRGLKTLEETVKLTWKDLRKIRNAGKKCWNELQGLIKEHNLSNLSIPENDVDPVYSIRPKSFTELLDTLNNREKFVIIHYHGYLGEEKKTLKEIGNIFCITRERTSAIRKKAYSKLFRAPRNKFFAFLPDDLMLAVFGTEDVDEIIHKLAPWRVSYEKLRNDIYCLLECQNAKVDRYTDKVNRNYDDLKDNLQGTNFNRYLSAIDKLASRLESQCVNFQSSLQIAQKLLTSQTKTIATENVITNLLNEISEHVFRLGDIEERLNRLILDKEILTGK